ncbi:hypothetical protein BBK82_30095 [Lentzea guizhouensis]|uniref:Uncharacterized protein n=1 Tax=Lentzea guizhouensis TaxID=1586287 RepID=A0A1B2HPL4_9PSEU|nr:hypothetical protein [Lentzea guizhouensis]ANZ39664.1 hypothetical protein BBK82_30095 [Lentzea guizhouensis]
MRIALAHRAEIAGWSQGPQVLLWAVLGTYTGWSSVAVWVNLTTALTGSGAPIDGPAGVAGQAAVFAGATAIAVVLVSVAVATAWFRMRRPAAA